MWRPLLLELCGFGAGREILCFCTGTETTRDDRCLELFPVDPARSVRTGALMESGFLVPARGSATRKLGAENGISVPRGRRCPSTISTYSLHLFAHPPRVEHDQKVAEIHGAAAVEVGALEIRCATPTSTSLSAQLPQLSVGVLRR